jgi:hypothetical protein
MEGIAMALSTIGITNLRPKKADYVSPMAAVSIFWSVRGART